MINEERQIQTNEDREDSIFRLTLKELCNNHKLVSVFSDINFPTRFSAGFILDVSKNFVLMAHITPFGFYDGFIIKKLSHIFKIESDGKYGNKVQKLYQIQNQSHTSIQLSTESPVCNLLIHAMNYELIVCGEMLDSENDDFQGYVTKIDNASHVRIQSVDDYGRINGIQIIKIDDITHLACDSDNEAALKILFEKN